MNPSFFTDVINTYLPEPHASLLNGIIFGIPLKGVKLFYEQLKDVGLLHIAVLSGTNITILSAVTTSLTSSFGKRISILLTILIIISFVIFVGPEAPIIRAGIMGILTSVAIIYGRRSSALYTLFLSAIIIALVWPDWPGTVSFQLSYAATLGIILFGSTNSKASGILKEIKPTLAAQLFTVPITFIYFKEVSLIAPLSNLLIAFAIPPLMFFGFLTAVLGKVNFLLGLAPAFVCHGLLSYIVFIVNVLSELSFASLQF
jgi:competence protein ComEC